MCIMILKPKNVSVPTYDTLCRCARHNPHGFGFSIPNNKPFKTLDFDRFIEEIYSVDENLPMIIHFRYATHGSIKPSNCHPFKDDSNGLIFAHNGVLGINTLRDKTDSETAFKLLFSPSADKYGFGSQSFKNAVETIRGNSRFGFMNDKGEIIAFGTFYDKYGNLECGSNFKVKNKVLFSNRGFQF